MLTNRIAGIILAATIIAIVAAVFWGNPFSSSGLFLPCFFHKATGLYCPGCGATRGVCKLLHGDVRGALGSNILLPFILGIIGYEATRVLAWHLFDKDMPSLRFSKRIIITAGAVVFVFVVLRNIPFEPFCQLAP